MIPVIINQTNCNFEVKSAQAFHFGSRSAVSNIIFMINELDLLWVPNFIALGIYFIFGTKFSWNEGIDTCFNVECVLLGCNFDFCGGYLVVSAHYVEVTAGCSLLPGGYWWLLLVTGGYCSLLLVPTFSMNAYFILILVLKVPFLKDFSHIMKIYLFHVEILFHPSSIRSRFL